MLLQQGTAEEPVKKTPARSVCTAGERGSGTADNRKTRNSLVTSDAADNGAAVPVSSKSHGSS